MQVSFVSDKNLLTFWFNFSSSINPGKGWRIMFDYIFTKDHLINKSYFISKNVGKVDLFASFNII